MKGYVMVMNSYLPLLYETMVKSPFLSSGCQRTGIWFWASDFMYSLWQVLSIIKLHSRYGYGWEEKRKKQTKIMLCATSDKEKVLISMQICDCLSCNNAFFFPAFFRLKLALSTWLCMEYKFRNNFSMNELSSAQKKRISSSVLRKTHLYIFSSLQPDCLIF